jgi:hypothetical protein
MCKPEWCNDIPSGRAAEMTENDSMMIATFSMWLQYFSQYKPCSKVLLIFDGAPFHLDMNTERSANAPDVTLFCLPSNTTHNFQPTDMAIFK